MTKILDWRGPEVRAQAVRVLARALGYFGLVHETEAKGVLKPRRGVLTGTLRRSIHAAGTGYNFAGDDVQPGPGTPERGNRDVEPTVSDAKIAVVAGTGMSYARPVEARYRYMEKGHQRALPQLPALIERAGREEGLL